MPCTSQLGNNIIVEPPSSSIVIEKSVPRTPIVAVGVVIIISCLDVLAICPDAYFIVPSFADRFNLPFFVLGSYTNSSMISLLCCVTSTLVSSIKRMPTLPLPVFTVSYCSIGSSCSNVISVLSRSITPLPSSLSTLPMLAHEGPAQNNITSNIH